MRTSFAPVTTDLPTALHFATAKAARLPVTGPSEARLTLADGTILVSDIYRPDVEGTFPVLLMRQPYGRRIASTVVLAHPAWYAAHGYVVVVQDVRGTGSSSGDFEALQAEAADGAQTLAWASGLPGGNGKIGLYGFSYQAMTQYLALAGAAKAGTRLPDAIAPAMGAFDIRDDWAFEGNAFRSAGALGWALQMAALKARHRGDAATLAAIEAVPPYSGGGRAVLDAHPGLTHFHRWLADEEADWQRVSPHHLLDGTDLAIPALHIGGWFDFLLTGTLKGDAAFRAACEATSHLLVGPWSHMPWNTSAGTANAGANAAIPVDRAIVAFFDCYLKGEGAPPPPVRLYDMVRQVWRTFSAMPDPELMPVFLASGGLAATTSSDGRLAMEPGEGDADWLVHDPFRPAPLVGGHLGTPAGYADRRAADDRADVAVYTMTSSPRPVDLVGPVTAIVHVSSDAPSFDLVATLSVLDPAGAARVLATGIARRRPGESGPAIIGLRAVCATIPPGHTLRLSLQGAAAPAFAVNPGTGDDPDRTPGQAGRIITLIVAHGGDTPSRLILPVVT